MTTPPTPATEEQSIEQLVELLCIKAIAHGKAGNSNSTATRNQAADAYSEAHYKLLSRIRELEAVVAKMPRTADGALLIDCERLYCPSGHPVERIDDGRCWCEKCEHSIGGAGRSFDETECYSTGAAAIAARKENTGGTP